MLKSKVYEDPSLALKIPIGELLDGTKTSDELKKKYSMRNLMESLVVSHGLQESHYTGEDVGESIIPKVRVLKRNATVQEKAQKYETKLTTDLKEIAGLQQSRYLVPSAMLFNDIRDLVSQQNNPSLNDSSQARPISAKTIYDKAKMAKAASVRTLEPIQDKKDVITETDAIDSVSRSKVDVRTIKKNSYQIRNKATVPSISGYRAKKLIDIDKKEDMEEELKKKQASKFSPFLLYPMDENQEIGDIFETGHKKSNNLLSLEYFLFPEFLDKDDIMEKYVRIKEISHDQRVYGYTKFFDNHGGFTWKRCELLEYDSKEETFLIKWIDKFTTKKVTRSNFYFELEDRKEYFRMLSNASRWRELSCTYMRYLDMIDKITTPTNLLRDEIKDRITLLVLNNQYRLKPPRDPVAKEAFTAKDRFDCNKILTHLPVLSLPANYNVVEHFSSKKYDLKYFNKLNEEIAEEFVRANHRIELENSLPFNHQLQAMFKGLLDDSLFVPLYIKQRLPAKEFGLIVPLSSDKREESQYLEMFTTMKSKLHVANSERIAIIGKVNSFLQIIKGLHFVMVVFDKGYDIPTFLDNQAYAGNNFFREIADKIIEVNEMIFAIVSRELEDMKKRNEHREKTITIASQKANLMEKELPAQVVRTLTRFMKMINFKFEYYTKEAVRASLLAYNKSFQNILDRFERILSLKSGSLDFGNLSYNTVLDYQNLVQYQKPSEDCPLIFLKLSVVEKEVAINKFGVAEVITLISFEKEMDSFKDTLKKVDLIYRSGSTTGSPSARRSTACTLERSATAAETRSCTSCRQNRPSSRSKKSTTADSSTPASRSWRSSSSAPRSSSSSLRIKSPN